MFGSSFRTRGATGPLHFCLARRRRGATRLATLGSVRNPPCAPAGRTLYGLIFGAIVGALSGLLLHALQGGRRNFASLRSMQPSHYEVVVDEEVADEAVRLIGGLHTTGGGPTRT